ncbi:MAG: hypothetical protein LC131_07300 [Anaerolineae bacterium]|nr:hypothetical protein [Anaerolineae bacterium]
MFEQDGEKIMPRSLVAQLNVRRTIRRQGTAGCKDGLVCAGSFGQTVKRGSRLIGQVPTIQVFAGDGAGDFTQNRTEAVRPIADQRGVDDDQKFSQYLIGVCPLVGGPPSLGQTEGLK